MEKLVAPLAYFLTWTTYGTRLHGDSRGTVDDGFNRFGTPFRPPSRALMEYERSRLRYEPLRLGLVMRPAVHGAIVDHCRIRGWRLWALNVRTTHVHVVVTTPSKVTPAVVENQLKAWGTRRLRESGLVDPLRTVWTTDGSKRQLWNDESLAAAIDYVLNRQ